MQIGNTVRLEHHLSQDKKNKVINGYSKEVIETYRRLESKMSLYILNTVN